jgi:hypothetical protein
MGTNREINKRAIEAGDQKGKGTKTCLFNTTKMKLNAPAFCNRYRVTKPTIHQEPKWLILVVTIMNEK